MKLQFRKPLEDLVPYPPGKPIEEVQREYGLKSVVKLASNENPLGASPKAKEAICAGLDELHLYPESACYYLREKLAKHLNVAEETLFFGNGSDEIVQLLATAFLEPGTNVVFSNLAFVRYPMGAQMMGAERRPVPMKNWKHDIDGFLAAVDANTRFVFLSNPNNPVGSAVTTQEVERLLAALPKNVIVGIDEAYREYAADFPDYPDSLELMKKYENLISLRTFSKAYGLAGLRVGYGIGSPEIWDAVERVRPPFNVNRLAQVAAVAALDDAEHIERTCKSNEEGKKYLYEELKKLGLSFIPTYANFILMDLERPAGPVYEGLLRRGVIARPVGIYKLPNHLRVTIGLPEENVKFIDALREVLRNM